MPSNGRSGETSAEILHTLHAIQSAAFEAAALAALAGAEALSAKRAEIVAVFERAAAETAASIGALEGVDGVDAKLGRAAARLAERLSEVGQALSRGEAPAAAELFSIAEDARVQLGDVARDITAKREAAAAADADKAEGAAKEARAVIDSAVDEIDQISLNVRLISLNASVEAARAGEAGRGFGVIAAEIQNLATRSQVAVESVRRQLATIS